MIQTLLDLIEKQVRKFEHKQINICGIRLSMKDRNDLRDHVFHTNVSCHHILEGEHYLFGIKVEFSDDIADDEISYVFKGKK